MINPWYKEIRKEVLTIFERQKVGGGLANVLSERKNLKLYESEEKHYTIYNEVEEVCEAEDCKLE